MGSMNREAVLDEHTLCQLLTSVADRKIAPFFTGKRERFALHLRDIF